MSDEPFSPIMALPAFAAVLAERDGISRDEAEGFIEGLLGLILEQLREGEKVKVKGIGTFQVVEQDGMKVPQFAPEKRLADQVNAPFALFEAVELAEGVDLGQVDTEESAWEEVKDPVEEEWAEESPIVPPPIPKRQAEQLPVQSPKTEAESDHEPVREECGVEEPTPAQTFTPVFEPIAETVTKVAAEPAASPAADTAASPAAESENEPTPTQAVDAAASTLPAEPPAAVDWEEPIEAQRCGEEAVAAKTQGRGTWWKAAILVGFLCAGMVIGYFGYGWLNLHDVESVNISAQHVQVVQNPLSTPEVEKAVVSTDESDSIAEVQTVAVGIEKADSSANSPLVPAVVTDTVRPGRFLTTMARKHYGQKKFWVYIYLENQDVIRDPDNVPSGTVVVIPPAEKYNIRPGDALSEQQAERKATEIANNRR